MLSKVLKNTFATGHLLTWGQTSYGWGRPNNGQPWTPGTIPNFNDIESVSTGQYHLGFITNDHSVFTVGLADDGRLGQGSINSSDISAVPSRISFGDSAIITSLSCGSRHSLALSADGHVYSWGSPNTLGIIGVTKNDIPTLIPPESFHNEKVVRIQAARDYSVALTENNHLYVWGSGLRLIPKWEQTSQTPVISKEVEQLVHKRHAKITKFFAIGQFIILLLDNGRIYCRGYNNGGIFGARMNPLVISDNICFTFNKTFDELYKGEKIVDFEASSNSLIFRTETDKIFYTGMFVKYQPTPFPLNVRAKKIFATQSSVGIVAQDGKIYYLNEKLIDDSDFVNKDNRLFVCEDENFNSEILDIGGSYHLRYALVK